MHDSTTFGPHMTLDLSQCEPGKLADLDFVHGFLQDLPEHIGMTKITQPYVFRYAGLVPEDEGITGFVLIAESHVSVHTFQHKGYAFVDLFSCRPFDVEAARDYIIAAFGSSEPKVQVVQRGADFPRSALPPSPVAIG